MRFHLFPFRTEKLSSLTPMVLRFFRGRVGSRLLKPSCSDEQLGFFCLVPGSAGNRMGLYPLDFKRRFVPPHADNPPKSPFEKGDFEKGDFTKGNFVRDGITTNFF